MNIDKALETLFTMANVQDGYAKKATDPGLKIIHKANAKAQREVAAAITDLRAARADAQAAVALVVERAGKVLRDTEVPAEWTSEGAIQRRALNYAATVLDALAPDAGTAELAKLRERAEKAEQERDAAVRGRNDWRDDFKALAAAIVGDTGLSAMTVAAQARTFRPRAEKAEADRDRLAAELAQARADTDAAVALVVERAADVVSRLIIEQTFGQNGDVPLGGALHRIRALAPADGLAAVEALRVEARENAMQALASMGQAQEAYEAQLEAEAELAAAQQREAGLRGALSYLRTQAKNGTLHPQVVIQNADASLAAWPEDGE